MSPQEGTSPEPEPTEEQVLEALRQVIDPELGINIVDLGLVYRVEIGGGRVRVSMTMTSPACPLNAYLSEMATSAIFSSIPQVRSAKIDLVWDPPWSPERMTEEARRRLGQPD